MPLNGYYSTSVTLNSAKDTQKGFMLSYSMNPISGKVRKWYLVFVYLWKTGCTQ